MHPTINDTISHRQDTALPLPPIVCILQYQVALQKNGEIWLRIDHLTQILTHQFFNYITGFTSFAQSVVLKPTDHLLRRCCCHPLAFNKTKLKRKKNGEKRSCFDDVTVVFSQFFQLTCCFSSVHAVCGIDAHRLAFAPSLPPPTRIHFSRVAAQKEW